MDTDAQLVVIGSSAGGIEALSRVVASLPGDFPAPVVIAQHLDPRRPSHLGEILGRHATLPIRVVSGDEPLVDGSIYVVPSNRHVEVANGGLRLRPGKAGAIAPSVDLLLESAAVAFGPGLIAVILTGSGTDGSAGAWHVKRAGGAVVIENPETAQFPSMPRSISPSIVDVTADLDNLGPVLVELLAAGASVPRGREGREFAALLDRIRARSGIDFGSYKTATIMRRLRGRMNNAGAATVAEYAQRLEHDPVEYAKLVSSMLIKVTDFFRDPKVFDHLRTKTLPALIADARRTNRQLRVWSAGCSTGEEAYSLAIAVAEAMDAAKDRPEVRVFATDIDTAAIAFARRGVYPVSALAKVPEAIRSRYFVQNDGSYEVEKSVRAMMIFGEHDLGARAPFPRIDLVLCRNVLIYFSAPMQRNALETFGFSLREGGRLVLGPSETVAAMPAPFVEEDARLRIYRRVSTATSAVLSPTTPIRPARNVGVLLDSAIRVTRHDLERATDSTEAAEDVLLDLRVGVVAVDTRYYITRINTAARRLLGIHGLAFDQDFIHLAESLPSTAIRSAIDAALSGKTTSTVHEVESAGISVDGGPRFIETVVRPYLRRPGGVKGAIVELTDVTRAERDRLVTEKTARQLARASQINTRLVRANDEVTALVAQLRLANEAMLQSSEEAQSGREEVETLNEEFQATNEELETLNEELTASVEELRVANIELATRSEELRLQTVALADQKQASEEEHNRLQSVLASLGDAVVAVDHDGHTIATNPAYDRLFGGPDADVEPEDLAGLPIPVTDRPQQRAARGERVRMEFAVSEADGSRRWFEAVTEPLTSEDRTWGGVVAIRDVSERTMRLSLERLMAAAGHELKTPTAAIHNYLQLVDRHLAAGEADKAGRYAKSALGQAQRLATLIERLLDVGRIQSGQLELLPDVIDLRAVVQSAVEVAQVLTRAPLIDVTVDPKRILIRGDSSRLEQVFLNLLSNAMEHAPGSDPIEVRVTTEAGQALVIVRDHGPGVKAADIRTMFDAYTRLGKSTGAPGLGLGLYVAREIVTAHGGEIEAMSRYGSGTTISVRLPLLRRARAGSTGPRRPEGPR